MNQIKLPTESITYRCEHKEQIELIDLLESKGVPIDSNTKKFYKYSGYPNLTWLSSHNIICRGNSARDKGLTRAEFLAAFGIEEKTKCDDCLEGEGEKETAEQAAAEYANTCHSSPDCYNVQRRAFQAGAQWPAAQDKTEIETLQGELANLEVQYLDLCQQVEYFRAVAENKQYSEQDMLDFAQYVLNLYKKKIAIPNNNGLLQWLKIRTEWEKERTI